MKHTEETSIRNLEAERDKDDGRNTLTLPLSENSDQAGLDHKFSLHTRRVHLRLFSNGAVSD